MVLFWNPSSHAAQPSGMMNLHDCKYADSLIYLNVSSQVGMHILEAIMQDESGLCYICSPMSDHLLQKMMTTWEHLVCLPIHSFFIYCIMSCGGRAFSSFHAACSSKNYSQRSISWLWMTTSLLGFFFTVSDAIFLPVVMWGELAASLRNSIFYVLCFPAS